MSTQSIPHSALHLAQFAGITTPVHAVRQTSVASPRQVARATPSPAPSAQDRQDFQAGVLQERRRWASVLSSRAFTLQPVVAAHLLANSSQLAGEIITAVRQISTDSAAAPREQAATIADRWSAAFKRMEATAASGDGPRPSTQIEQRWDAAAKRAGVAGPAR
jgi:hypothetical protein